MIITAVIAYIIYAIFAAYALYGFRLNKRCSEPDREAFCWIADLRDAVCRKDSPEKTAQMQALTSRLSEAHPIREALNQEILGHLEDLIRIMCVTVLISVLVLVAAALL